MGKQYKPGLTAGRPSGFQPAASVDERCGATHQVHGCNAVRTVAAVAGRNRTSYGQEPMREPLAMRPE